MDPLTSPPPPSPSRATAPRLRPRGALRALLALLVALAGVMALSPPSPAEGLTSTGHGRGHLWAGDGVSWLGTYRLSDGRFAFCLEVGRSSPVGHDYEISDDAPGLGLSTDDRARLAFISRTWAGTTNADTAAAAQLAVWSITGLGGHTLDYYAGRANGNRAAVLAKAGTFIARAAAEASRSATATVALSLAATGKGTVTADLRTALQAGGTRAVAPGSHTGTITLTGGKFGTGSATVKQVGNGRPQAIRATGFGPVDTVTARVAFSRLPYEPTLTVGASSAGSQRLLFKTTPTGTAAKAATTTAVSPRPFQPRVVTATSSSVAEAGASLADDLTLQVKAVSGQLTEWGVYASGGTTHPIPVTIRSRLLGPFPTQPAKSATWPGDAPEVCRVATVASAGAGRYRTPSCILPSGGYFVWVETIDPRDTPVAKGRDRVGAWTSPFAQATEVTQVPAAPAAPRVATRVDTPDAPGPDTCVTDVLDVAGLAAPPSTPVDVESILLGPFDDAPEDGHDFGPESELDALPVAGRATTSITADGRYRTPCIETDGVGHYVFVFRSEGSAPDASGRQEVPPFADLVAHDAEAFSVPKPVEPEVPAPTPSLTPPLPTPSPSATRSASPSPRPAPGVHGLLAFTGSAGAGPIALIGLGAIVLGAGAAGTAALRRARRTRSASAPTASDER